MTIDEIYKKEEISVRSYHVCKYNNINSVKDLKEYFYKRKSFDNLRNCGRKSNEELIELCNKYQGAYLETQELQNNKENPLKTIISELTRVQREVINSFILVNTNSLTVRSKNGILLHLKNNLKIKNFAEKILLSENFAINNIRNIGAKCIPEIGIYISIIKDFLIEVSQSNDEKQLISLKNNFLIQRTFSISKIPSEILESESIFLLTDFLLNSNALFDNTQTVIVKKAFKIYQNQKELTLDDIADEVKLTRERVRQIRVICLDELFNKLSFIQNFNDDLFQKYNIDTNSNQIEINQDLIDIINITNLTFFSREFITYTLYVYLSDRFSLIGSVEDVIQPKYFNARKRHNWNNFFLIKKEIVNEIDFNALANDIDNRISDRIVESYSFNFKSYLSRFLINNNIEILDSAFPIGEKIINDEFELHLDLDENLIFKRNTKKQAHEYAYEALEHLGKPSKVTEIFEKVLELYPNYDTDEPKVRVSMKRKNGFVPIGRKSVFGLKKWEKELDNFKGGTIRDIVEEYLFQFAKPIHISEITSYVLKYRPKSNQYSILQNLKLDESGLYIFYKGSHVGLSTKKYTEEHVKSKSIDNSDRKSWEERFDALQSFTQKEKRLPYSNGVPEKEIKLYRWLNVQKSKISKGKLNANKTDKINDIIDKFPSINGKRRSNSIEKYEELIAFVKSNFRLPSASKNGEENLYQFFYKQRKLFDKDKLEAKEEIQFIEVAKLLQNIKYENKRN
nr:Helicase associated domain protein [uncultured Psychroserpens sp.]